MRSLHRLLIAVLACSAVQPVRADLDFAARKKYEPNIAKARNWLLSTNLTPGTGEGALAAYALVKAGIDHDNPRIQALVAGAEARVNSSAYRSGPEPAHHVYDAACDAMLLTEIDPVRYKPQLEILRDYLVRKQLASGAWYYPNAAPDVGDTSITQFALLGLWATKRAGVDVPVSTWENCARWLFRNQQSNGGFSYHPMETMSVEHTLPTHTMTAAGCGSLLVIRRMLHGETDADAAPTPPPTSKKRFGVLENLPTEKEKPAVKKDAKPTISEGEFKQAIKKSQDWLAGNFTPQSTYFEYYFYACERTGALLDTETFGSHRWYEEGANILLKFQKPTGEFQSNIPATGNPTPVPETIFALLFFSRATQSIVAPAPKVERARLHGGGLLGAGRGLPDDLSQVDVQGGSVKKRVPKTSIDSLLAELEKPAAEVSEAAQTAVVEAVQLENRDALIGQIDRIKRLIRDPRPEVRQVAVWALGRSDDLRQAPLLIAALKDPDFDVAAEASLALCVLSRQPEGVRKPGSKGELVPIEPPEPMLQEDAAAYAKRATAWQAIAQPAWHDWYLQVRPYDERNDRQEMKKK